MFDSLEVLTENYNITEDNPSIECTRKTEGYSIDLFPCIDYSFCEYLPLADAINRISRSRTLFSFFGNGFISWGTMSFVANDNKEYGLWLDMYEDSQVILTSKWFH